MRVRTYGFPGIFYEANPDPRLATSERSDPRRIWFAPCMCEMNDSAALPEDNRATPASPLSILASMKLQPLGGDRLDEIVALVLRADETWRPWAPRGWDPPPAARERASWKDRLEGRQHWVQGALDEDGTLLGVAAWRPAIDGSRGRVGHLGMLFVSPEAWGRGIGGVLLAAAEASMRGFGCARGRLNVAERNPARSFYERHGWASAGPPVYSPGLDIDLVPYEKEL